MDIANVATIFTSIKTATDIAKLIKDSDLSLEKAETKLKLAELISALADVKIEVVELQQVLSDKDAQLQKLQKELQIRKHLDYRDPAYWLKSESGDAGPFCQLCYDTSAKLVRLQDENNGSWRCNACKNVYHDPDRRVRNDAVNAAIAAEFVNRRT